MSRFCVFILGLLAACAASALTLQQLSMDQMTESATAIVRVRVVGSSASFTGSTIYTHYKLQVTETWKGSATAEVMLPGGIANGYRQSIPGVPTLTVGAEYLLFLWTSSQTGITHLVGMSQGLFYLSPQADGSTLAMRPLVGEMMLDANGRRVNDRAVAMSLTDMRTRVTQTAARPVSLPGAVKSGAVIKYGAVK
jgi:hypothetical protein